MGSLFTELARYFTKSAGRNIGDRLDHPNETSKERSIRRQAYKDSIRYEESEWDISAFFNYLHRAALPLSILLAFAIGSIYDSNNNSDIGTNISLLYCLVATIVYFSYIAIQERRDNKHKTKYNYNKSKKANSKFYSKYNKKF